MRPGEVEWLTVTAAHSGRLGGAARDPAGRAGRGALRLRLHLGARACVHRAGLARPPGAARLSPPGYGAAIAGLANGVPPAAGAPAALLRRPYGDCRAGTWSAMWVVPGRTRARPRRPPDHRGLRRWPGSQVRGARSSYGSPKSTTGPGPSTGGWDSGPPATGSSSGPRSRTAGRNGLCPPLGQASAGASTGRS